MRILYDSKLLAHKDPFGTLTPDETCRICIHIPASVMTTAVTMHITAEDGTPARPWS